MKKTIKYMNRLQQLNASPGFFTHWTCYLGILRLSSQIIILNIEQFGVRKMPGNKETLGHLSVSCVIIVILMAQFLVGTFTYGPRRWPIISYPMYAGAKYHGDRLKHDFRVFGVLSDDSRIEASRSELGLSFWIFHANIIDQIARKQPEKLKSIVAQLCEKSGGKLVRLEYEDLGVIITKQGPVSRQPPMINGFVDVTC